MQNEVVTIKATKGSDGKFYYFESRGDIDPNSPYPIQTVRISKSEFDRLAKKQKKNYDKEYDGDGVLVKFKYEDDRASKWIKQNEKQKSRSIEAKTESKNTAGKRSCAGVLVIGLAIFVLILFTLL